MDKLKPFKEFLDTFETESMKLYCADMIERIPDYIFYIPSSTSLKYHNATQCQPGGQIFHMLMANQMISYVLSLEYIKEKIPQKKKRDCLRVAMCLHDALKCGVPGENNQYTVFQHPLLASEWIKTTKVPHDIKQGLKDYIGRLCESHSGEWNSSKKTDQLLPKPENDEQFIIHLCDYLSSRSNLDMIYSEEVKKQVRELAVPNPEDYFFPKGWKYEKCNFGLVYEMDKDYLRWLKTQDKFPVPYPLKVYLEEYID